MSNFDIALEAARKWHAGQVRKYTGTPYVLHPERVASAVVALKYPEQMACAALLHDVIEDCKVTAPQIASLFPKPFGDEVAVIVTELTNPSKGYTKLSRAERKKMDREHLNKVSFAARIIKLLDRTDNLREMTGADLEFKKKYAQESLLLVECLIGTDAKLEAETIKAAKDLVDPWKD